MAIATAFLAFLVVLPAAYAVEYTVGDTSGWTQGLDYTAWTSGKTFAVGDTLLFTYGRTHSVDVVSKSDYDTCGTGNALESYSDGNTQITLSTAGTMYFLCPVPGHCTGGQKLAVTVAAATAPTTPSPTTPSPTTPSPTTPSPTTPSPTTPSPTTPSPTTPSPTTPSPTTPSPTTPSPTTPSPTTPSPTTPSPTTTPTTTTPAQENGASGNLYNMNSMVLGACMILAPLFAIRG